MLPILQRTGSNGRARVSEQRIRKLVESKMKTLLRFHSVFAFLVMGSLSHCLAFGVVPFSTRSNTRFGIKRSDLLTATVVAAGDDVSVATPPTWEELVDQLPAEAEEDAVLTLYRDTNGWCPFCERVWVALKYKKIPFKESVISLQNKPEWYKELVPSALVPAVVLYGSNETNERTLLWESMDILQALDDKFPSTPKLMKDTPEFNSAVDEINKLATAGLSFTYGRRMNDATDEKAPEDYKAEFSRALDKLDATLAANGPFRLGKDLTAVDVIMIPNMERWRYQLPLTKGFDILEGRPHVQNWFEAVESIEGYRNRVMGDAYSWTAVTSTLLRYFAQDKPETQEAIDVADAAALKLSNEFALYEEESAVFATEAAKKLISNHEAVVADSTRQDPLSQKHISRASDPTIADQILRFASSILLEGGNAIQTAKTTSLPTVEDAKEGARVLRTVALRSCVPRDMGAPAAGILRAVFFILASRLEEGK